MMENKIQSDLKTNLVELFSRYEFVISGHFWFNRFPEWIGSASDHISIIQKLKAKCYLWIRKVEKEWITFDSIKMHDWAEILDYDISKFNQQYQKAINFLENRLDLHDKNYWFEISVVSECTKWEWVWFTGTIMALLVSWIYYQNGKLSHEDLRDYEKFQASNLFKEITNLAHQCTIIAKDWNIWSAFLTVLAKWSHPYAYITDLKDELKYKDVDKSFEYAKQLPELFKVDNFPMENLPICWAIIYTWQKSDSLFAVRQKKFLEYFNLKYQNRFEQSEISSIDSQLKLWLEKSNYYEIEIRNLSNMSINILYIFEKIYRRWLQTSDVHWLIDILNWISKKYNSMEQDFDITNDFQKSCIKNWVSIDTFWLSPIYTNKYGGNYLVVFEDDSDLDVLETVLEDMKNNYPDIRIRETYDFVMPAKDGIVIEQDINNNIWKEIWKDLYVLLNNDNEQKFVSYTDINPKEQKWIFFDGVKNKVYVNWKVLTSKDIKSATTTIELFYYLLKSEDHEVKNNELWPSSFSWQQNQMESKIISPFVKYIKKIFGKELDIECSGSLREFYITLWKTDIPIQLVKKY